MAISPRPPTPAHERHASEAAAHAPIRTCSTDFSTQCPTCGVAMQPEHAHYRCLACGYRDSCCM